MIKNIKTKIHYMMDWFLGMHIYSQPSQLQTSIYVTIVPNKIQIYGNLEITNKFDKRKKK